MIGNLLLINNNFFIISIHNYKITIMKHNKKYNILLISIVIIALILFACCYFKIFPFNEEQFKLEDEMCFKTCINTTEQPYVRTSLIEKTVTSNVPTPTVEIPLAPTKTITGAIPTPPILSTPVTNINVKSPIMDTNINPLLSDIRKGLSLKPILQQPQPIDNSIIPQAPTKTMTGAIPTPPIFSTPSTNLNVKSPVLESSNPLLDQIRKSIQLKPTSPIQKDKTSSNSVVTPSLQDEISKRIASRRQYIEDDSDSFDEFFRYRGFDLY